MNTSKKLNHAVDMAKIIVDMVQDMSEEDMELAINSVCISYVALVLANKMSLHKAINLLMLFYKNTQLTKD